MSDFASKLNELKTLAEQRQIEKTRAEANLENLKQRKAELEAELGKLGVKPEDLQDKIDGLKSKINSKLEEAEKLLNKEV